MERQKIVHNKILDYAYTPQHCVYKDQQIALHKGHHIPTNQPVIIKIVDTRKSKPEELQSYFNSLKIFKALEHENIAKILQIVNAQNSIFIIYEHVEVSLQQVLSNGKVTEEEAIQVLEQIVAALVFLHSKNIIHNSLSSSNIMIKPNKNGGLKIKLAHPSQNQQLLNKFFDCFSSPEAILKKIHVLKGDIWGMGVVYFQLLNGEQSTKSMDFEQFIKLVSAVSTYKQMPSSNWSKNLLSKMLVIDYEKRADIFQIGQILKTRVDISGKNSILVQDHKAQIPQQQQSRPSTNISNAPPKPVQIQNESTYHRSPLKYVNNMSKSPLRRNHTVDNVHSKSPMSHRQIHSEKDIQLNSKIIFYFELALSVQKMLFMFNQAKLIYEQAVRITLLTLKHFTEIVSQLQRMFQTSKSNFSEDQQHLLQVLKEKIEHFKSCNLKKMEHDTYFTHILRVGKQNSYQFLNYIQFWLRLAIRHTIDFLQTNKRNTIQRRYLQGIFWSYLHALKYYDLLQRLKGDRKGHKVPQSIMDKILNQRPSVTLDTFKVLQEEAIKALKI